MTHIIRSSSTKKLVGTGIGVCIFREGKILLGRRQKSSRRGVGTWGLPGGKLEFGESFADCARRETLEESGLHISKPVFITATNDIFGGEHFITIFMRADWVSGEPLELEPDKMADWTWFAWEDLPRPLFMPFENLMKTGFKF